MIKISEFNIPNKKFTQKEVIELLKYTESKVNDGYIINIIPEKQTKLDNQQKEQPQKENSVREE